MFLLKYMIVAIPSTSRLGAFWHVIMYKHNAAFAYECVVQME